VLVYRLLSGLGAEGLVTLTDREVARAVERREGRVLPGRYHYFLRKGLRGNRFALGQVVNGSINLALAVVAGVRGARLARRYRARCVLGVADDGFSQIAASIASAVARVPYVLMFFDLWEENAYTPFQRRVARLLERRLLQRAAAVVVHCREMAHHYRLKHGIEAVVLPTPVDVWEPTPRQRPSGVAEVLYGGAVYWAQEDAVRRLARARGAVDGVRLAIVGSWANREELAARGIDADVLEGELAPDRYRARIEQADVLFLGLSLESDHPDVVRTAAPAKLVEYMAAARPILVHAPRGSHVAEYAREGGFAAVVDEPNEGALAAELERLVEGGTEVDARIERGRALVLERHDTPVVRARFREILDDATRR
jgi:glycosyltransferase involved in cell wall biosynthesis